MNYTTNYHLPQWVESDRIMMEDFNDAMAGIDGGIAEAKTAANTAQSAAESAAAAASQAQSTANAAQSAAAAAQSTADAAQSAAATAQQTADNAWAPDNPPFVLGSYQGSGSSTRTSNKITLGFTPQVFFITNTDSAFLVAYGQDYLCDAQVTWNSDGLTLTSDDLYSRMDERNKMYHYCAFR